MALALYRKYRPRTFAEVIGQEHVTEPLSQALRSGRLHHAYLFSGPRGCGKTSSARILARSLNCEQGPTPEPCGVCGSCRSLANDGTGSIDVIEIDAASHGGVDDARELREKAFFAPANSRYKIYVIDEAHMVSSAGFNALLKLVEEPPEYVKFIFATTEPEKVLGTIRSRTHHYPFRLIPPATLRPYLQQLTEAEGVQVEPAVFPLVVRAGGGSARDSLSVLDQLIAGAGPEGVSYNRAIALLGVTDVTLLDEMCDALAAGDGAAAYSTIDRVAEAGHDPRRFASDLLERFRDLIVLQQVPDAVSKGLIDGPADQLEAMGAQAARLGPATLSRCADIVHNGLVEMRGTTAPRLLLELVTARMLLPGAEDSTGALLQRLERMERRLSLGGEPSPLPPGDAPTAAAASVPAAVPAPVPASGGGGSAGLSAARAAAAAAARRAGTGGRAATAQPNTPAAAPASAPVSAAPVSVAPASAPVSVAPVSAGPASAPVSAAPVSAASDSAAPVSVPSSSAVPVSAVPTSAVPESATQAGAAQAGAAHTGAAHTGAAHTGSAPAGGGAGADWNDVAAGMPDGGAAIDGRVSEPDYEEPPWDDEPDDFDSGDGRPAALSPSRQAAPTPNLAPASSAMESGGSTASARAAESSDGDSAGEFSNQANHPVRRSEPVAEAILPGRPESAGGGAPAGVLPDAPEEPAAAAVEAAAAGPGQLTAQAVRQVWPEVLAEVRKQPRGVVLRAMAADATVRELEGETVVLTVPSPRHAQGITQGAALIVNALYEVLGGQWEIRCEVAGAAGATPYGGSAPARGGSAGGGSAGSGSADGGSAGGGRAQGRNQSAPSQRPDVGGQRQASGRAAAAPTGVAPAGAAPSGAAQQTAQPAAAGRAPHTQRRPSEAPAAGGDDDWPEPAQPGGHSTAAAAPVEDDEEDWPEVRAIPTSPPPRSDDQGRPASADVFGSAAAGSVDAGAAAVNPRGGDGAHRSGLAAESDLAAGNRESGGTGSEVTSSGAAGGGLDAGNRGSGGIGSEVTNFGAAGGGLDAGNRGSGGTGSEVTSSGAAGSGLDAGNRGSGGIRPEVTSSGAAGSALSAGNGGLDGSARGAGAEVTDPGIGGAGAEAPGFVDRDAGGVAEGAVGYEAAGGSPAAGRVSGSGREAIGLGEGGPRDPAQGERQGDATPAAGSSAVAAARAAAARAGANAARSAGGAPAPSAPAGAGGGAGAASTGRNSGPSSGLAAARAAAARGAAGARPAAKPANEAWPDGSPTEEAPYDPEFDGPPSGKAKFEGFDPGDEPLDEVIDEKTARESGEQMAMRLLQEAFGAEKIGES
ncbi:DNA polymerase III subunit gamma and tau [Actinoplanes sp. TRM88002]|uniref:DNA-directed DNA polymerase n=1 Tax=Paractinoplanes hotanensis TaxID=2906497 RepID=A0ABT0XUI5_9ACTN|nr:DNA polymerase III subunit gamma and tau [Actinoplanes hotanensis]MCM4077456.1 DNA polymerase III subunit gamma and tau [Actinoplanes hotanensis]